MRIAIPLLLVALLAGCESSREQKLSECLQGAADLRIGHQCRLSFDDALAKNERAETEAKERLALAKAELDTWLMDNCEVYRPDLPDRDLSPFEQDQLEFGNFPELRQDCPTTIAQRTLIAAVALPEGINSVAYEGKEHE